jgi:eukaryotic-like serine/threonine-protein kinase
VQSSIRKEVALKVLRRRFWNSTEAVSRFLREAQIVAQLPPEGIVGIHGLGRLPRGGYFMVMDLVDGQDLRARRNAGEVSPAQAALWVAAAAEIVGQVHAAGYVHGDLKPANILVEYGGRTLLTDFGFAHSLGRAEFPRRAGEIGGTPAFLAPELAANVQQSAGPPIDVFGLGSVLFWLLIGQAVHVEKDTACLLTSLDVPTWDAKVRERIPGSVPAGLTDLCRRCLARDPDDRPATRDVMEACRRFAAPPDAAGA